MKLPTFATLALAIVACTSLSACATDGFGTSTHAEPTPPPLPPAPADEKPKATIKNTMEQDNPSLDFVMQLIKEDIGRYRGYELLHKNDLPQTDGCKGSLLFHVSKISLVLQVVTDDKTVNGAPGLDLKLLSDNIEITDDHKVTHDLKNTRTLTIVVDPTDVEPIDPKTAPPPPTGDDLGIANTLIAAREQLLKESNTAPCFKLDTTDDSTFENEFNVDKSSESTTGLKFFVVGVSKDATRDLTGDNKVTVTFTATGTGKPKAKEHFVYKKKHGKKVKVPVKTATPPPDTFNWYLPKPLVFLPRTPDTGAAAAASASSSAASSSSQSATSSSQ